MAKKSSDGPKVIPIPNSARARVVWYRSYELVLEGVKALEKSPDTRHFSIGITPNDGKSADLYQFVWREALSRATERDPRFSQVLCVLAEPEYSLEITIPKTLSIPEFAEGIRNAVAFRLSAIDKLFPPPKPILLGAKKAGESKKGPTPIR